MSIIKIQEYIVQEIKINRMTCLKKGQTIASRDDSSEEKWTRFMVDRGYSEWDAAVIFKDAHDMAILELRCDNA